MRVLLVTGSFPPMTCGVGDYTRELAGALAAREDVEVGVLTSTAADRDTSGAFEVFPVLRDWKPSEFPEVREVVRAWKPDVVHVQYPTRGYHGSLPYRLPLLLRMRGIPVVQTWHEYVPRTGSPWDVAYARWRDLPGVLFGRDVIVVRPSYRERMPFWFRVLAARKRFHLVPNGPTVPRIILDDDERATIRERWGARGRALLAFFGLCYEHKGIDDLLAAFDPSRHHLVIVGGIDQADPYQAALLRRVGEPPLREHVTIAGFLPAPEAAQVLAAADAVVLPFRRGGGDWNTSMKAAALQGTFVLTTSTTAHGYDEAANVYWARPGDPADLATALARYLGRRIATPSPDVTGPDWAEIARRHVAIYASEG
jgi:glycosyltransferase involved in cell wall biosynthesis